jgi:hypothetical protein
MKKIIVFIFGLIYSFAVNAQIEFGIKAGFNRTNIMYSDSGGNNLAQKSGFNAGVFASIPLFNDFFLQPEVLFSVQGNGFTDSVDYKNVNNYLNVPVLFKYQHHSGLFVETGPQIGFLLSAQLKTSKMEWDARSGTATFDFSWAFGLGYKIPVVNLGIDLRYNLGLTHVYSGSFNAGPAKNSVFQIGLFYQFKLK